MEVYLHLLVTTITKTLGGGEKGRLFQSPFLLLDGFILQGCSLLLVVLGALSNTPLLLTIYFLLMGSFHISFVIFFFLTGIISCELGPQVTKNMVTYTLFQQ